MDPVSASLIVIATVLVIEAVAALIWYIRDQLRSVEITKGEIGVTSNRLNPGQLCTVVFSWSARNRNIRPPHMITVKTRLEIEEHGVKEEQHQYRANDQLFSGSITKTVSWSSPGEKEISAEIIIKLPDGREITASTDGEVEVIGSDS
jgi:hypothetical protein